MCLIPYTHITPVIIQYEWTWEERKKYETASIIYKKRKRSALKLSFPSMNLLQSKVCGAEASCRHRAAAGLTEHLGHNKTGHFLSTIYPTWPDVHMWVISWQKFSKNLYLIIH